jgi:hypothetical protein
MNRFGVLLRTAAIGEIKKGRASSGTAAECKKRSRRTEETRAQCNAPSRRCQYLSRIVKRFLSVSSRDNEYLMPNSCCLVPIFLNSFIEIPVCRLKMREPISSREKPIAKHISLHFKSDFKRSSFARSMRTSDKYFERDIRSRRMNPFLSASAGDPSNCAKSEIVLIR